MKRIKKYLSMMLVMVAIFSIFAMPAHAADIPSEDTAPAMLIGDPISLTRSECQDLYDYLTSYNNGDEDALYDVAGIIASKMKDSAASALVDIAELVGPLAYNYNMNQLYKGGYNSSYNGATLYIYDNTQPTIIAKLA